MSSTRCAKPKLEIRLLTARVEKLERELAKNSRNSSWPPSSDPPGKRPPKRGKFRARISTGSVERSSPAPGTRSANRIDDLLDRVRAAEALNMDETGWRLQGQRCTWWGAFTDRHAVLRIAEDRHEDRARELLSDSQADTDLERISLSPDAPIRWVWRRK